MHQWYSTCIRVQKNKTHPLVDETFLGNEAVNEVKYLVHVIFDEASFKINGLHLFMAVLFAVRKSFNDS